MRHTLSPRQVAWFGCVALALLSGAVVQAQERIVILRQREAPRIEQRVEQRVEQDVEQKAWWIGVACQPCDDTLRSHLKLEGGQGLIVKEIVKGSSADEAGLKVHDVLVAAGDRPLEDVHDLVEVVDASEGKELTFTLYRGGEKTEARVTPEAREQARWLRRFRKEDPPRERFGLRYWRPGVVVGRAGELPEGFAVTFTRDAEGVKVVVKKGDESWEATGETLDELPEAVRDFVERILRPGGGAFVPGGDFGGDLGFEWNIERFPPVGRVTPEQLKKQFDDLKKEVEELRKQYQKRMDKLERGESDPDA